MRGLPVKALALMIVSSLLFVVTACHDFSPWQGIIKVAVVAPYSGPLTASGLSMLDGARRAADELNRNGGIAGYRISIIAPDAGLRSTPNDVLADPQIVAVVGSAPLSTVPGDSPYARAGLVWLATEPVALSTEVYPLVASPRLVDRGVGQYLTTWASVSGDAAAKGVDSCDAATETGGGVVEVGAIELICGSQSEAAKAAVLAPATGHHFACVASWCDGPELSHWWRGSSFDYVLTDAPSTNATGWDQFAGRERGANRVPDAAAEGYDAVRLIGEAAARAIGQGPPSREAVGREIFRSHYEGILGAYDSRGRVGPAVEVRRFAGTYPGQLLVRVEG